MKREYMIMGVLMALMLLAVPVAGAGDFPKLVKNWQSGNAQFECQQAGLCVADYAYKIDDWGENGTIMNGDYSVSGNTIIISNDDSYTFDWVSAYPVCKVIVVGGGSANVFHYDPAVTSDKGLYGPENREISHVTFCFNEPENEPEIPMTYYIHGPKVLFCTGAPYLPGWTIVLEQFNETSKDFELYGKMVTNEDGNYKFSDVEPGKYRLSEEMQDHWTQVQHPEENYYIITIPDDPGKTPSENPNTVWYWRDFRNQPKLYTSDETAWAAQKNPGVTRFVTQGNWGTYVTYDVGGGSEIAPQKFPLYAGQHHLAGHLNVYDDNRKLYVTYEALGTNENPAIMGDYTVKWGLTECHLHVANSQYEIPRTPGRGRNAVPGNPIPGQFMEKDSFDPATGSSGVFVVDISGLNNTSIVIAAHAVMEWEGYYTEVYTFAIEKGWKYAWTPIHELFWGSY